MNDFKLKSITHEEFDGYYKLLENDFCSSERKSYQDELLAFDNSLFSPSYIYCNGELAGYICIWSFDDFIFIEHFAILKEKRSKHIGTDFLSHLLSDTSRLAILEVERPVDDISERRIAFYKRSGFAVNPYDYVQPSYHDGNDEIPMYICSYDRSISHREYLDFTAKIKTAVYSRPVY